MRGRRKAGLGNLGLSMDAPEAAADRRRGGFLPAARGAARTMPQAIAVGRRASRRRGDCVAAWPWRAARSCSRDAIALTALAALRNVRGRRCRRRSPCWNGRCSCCSSCCSPGSRSRSSVALAGFFVVLAGARAGLRIDQSAPLPALTHAHRPAAADLQRRPAPRDGALAGDRSKRSSATGQGARFDWYLLSDTTDPDHLDRGGGGVPRAARACRARRASIAIAPTTCRKAGNIAEWIARFGAAYDHMIVLDADSLMTGDDHRPPRRRDGGNPHAGAHPDVADCRQRVTACSPLAAVRRPRLWADDIAGNAWWQGPDGNYWGHNAIIRVAAFAEHASLPMLRGGGRSAAISSATISSRRRFMRRAGWAIYAGA